VRLNTSVRTVRTFDTPWGERAHVTTASGELLRARRVVVAVPLGVLKEAAGAPPEPLGTPAAEVASWRVSRAPNGLSFEPPLGGALARAVARVPVGRAIRVALEFGHRFWQARVAMA
jgi:monoamine oxidase